jgi:hypothetical protein
MAQSTVPSCRVLAQDPRLSYLARDISLRSLIVL